MIKHFPLAVIALLSLGAIAAAQHPIPFDVQTLAIDANEGCDVADIDGDGKLDITAGRNWYRNGDWVPSPLRIIEDNNGYARTNGEWAYDVNGDGRPDVVSQDFFGGELYWYENPGGDALALGQLWPQHLLGDTGQKNNEVSYLVDLTGDGVPEWYANQWNPSNPAMLWRLTKDDQGAPTLAGCQIGPRNAHGVGFGDINNDGRDDVLFGAGWYEQPESDPFGSEWTYHADWDKPHCACPMLVVDLDGDGLNDVINSVAHGYGIHWWKSLGPDADGKLQFEEHLIDDSFSQGHCLVLADLDGDGASELITGKRIRAHNGKDPGSAEPPITRYYVWDNAAKTFQGHTIAQAGGGLQIRPADLDADGDIDLVVAGKDGTQILWNKRK